MNSGSPFLRQWKLLALLESRSPGLGVDELALELAVNTKTIRRDLVLLRDAGLPIEESRTDHGRKLWRLITPGPLLKFNWEEALALQLARRFLTPLTGTVFWHAAESAFAKIRAGLGPQALQYLKRMDGKLHSTTPDMARYAAKSQSLDDLTLAIEECRITYLAYQSERSTEPVTREIHPYAWVFHRQSAYLAAFAVEHREVRLYKADRMHGADVTDLRFPRPADFDPARYLAGSFGVYRGAQGSPVTVRVRFATAVARYVTENQWHPSQQLTPQRDGSVVAEFTLSATEEIQRWILSFGEQALVEAPAELVKAMRRTFEHLAQAYGTGPREDSPAKSDLRRTARREPAGGSTQEKKRLPR